MCHPSGGISHCPLDHSATGCLYSQPAHVNPKDCRGLGEITFGVKKCTTDLFGCDGHFSFSCLAGWLVCTYNVRPTDPHLRTSPH